MPDVSDLGKAVKAKYPGVYDKLDDAALGTAVRARYPAYSWFADLPAGPPSSLAPEGPPAPDTQVNAPVQPPDLSGRSMISGHQLELLQDYPGASSYADAASRARQLHAKPAAVQALAMPAAGFVRKVVPSAAGLETGAVGELRRGIAALRAVGESARTGGFEGVKAPPPEPPPSAPKDLTPLVPQPRTTGQKILYGLGGAAGYGLEAAALTPLVGPEAAMAIPAMTDPGSVEERLASGGVMALGGRALEAAGQAAAGAPAIVRAAASVAAPAVTFGSVVPFAESGARKLVGGANVEWPKVTDIVPSVATLALAGAGMHAAARVTGTPDFTKVQPLPGISSDQARGFMAINKALAEPPLPPGISPQETGTLRASSAAATQALNDAFRGRRIGLATPDGKTAPVRVAYGKVYPYPGEPSKVRLVVEDEATGKVVPVQFSDIKALRNSLRPLEGPVAAPGSVMGPPHPGTQPPTPRALSMSPERAAVARNAALRLTGPGVAEALHEHYALGADLHPIAAQAQAQSLKELTGIMRSREVRRIARSSQDAETFRSRVRSAVEKRLPPPEPAPRETVLPAPSAAPQPIEAPREPAAAVERPARPRARPPEPEPATAAPARPAGRPAAPDATLAGEAGGGTPKAEVDLVAHAEKLRDEAKVALKTLPPKESHAAIQRAEDASFAAHWAAAENTSGPIEFSGRGPHEGDRVYLLSRTTGPNAKNKPWRVTRFFEDGPAGHDEYPSREAAIRELVKDGVTTGKTVPGRLQEWSKRPGWKPFPTPGGGEQTGAAVPKPTPAPEPKAPEPLERGKEPWATYKPTVTPEVEAKARAESEAAAKRIELLTKNVREFDKKYRRLRSPTSVGEMRNKINALESEARQLRDAQQAAGKLLHTAHLERTLATADEANRLSAWTRLEEQAGRKFESHQRIKELAAAEARRQGVPEAEVENAAVQGAASIASYPGVDPLEKVMLTQKRLGEENARVEEFAQRLAKIQGLDESDVRHYVDRARRGSNIQHLEEEARGHGARTVEARERQTAQDKREEELNRSMVRPFSEVKLAVSKRPTEAWQGNVMAVGSKTGWMTDGHMAIRRDAIKDEAIAAKLERVWNTSRGSDPATKTPEEEPNVAQVIPKVMGPPLKDTGVMHPTVPVSVEGQKIPAWTTHLETPDGEIVSTNAAKLALIEKHVDYDEIRGAAAGPKGSKLNPLSAISFLKDGRVVAILMPVRPPKDGPGIDIAALRKQRDRNVAAPKPSVTSALRYDEATGRHALHPSATTADLRALDRAIGRRLPQTTSRVASERLSGLRERARAKIAEMEAPGAQKLRQRPPAGPPIPTAVPRIPTKAETKALPTAEIPTGKPEERPGPLERTRDLAKQAFDELTALVNPSSLAQREAGRGYDAWMRHKGDLDRAILRGSRLQASVSRYFDGLPHEKIMAFWDRMEHGLAPAPGMEEIDASHRDRYDQVFASLRRYKEIPFFDNYIGHLWKDDRKARAFFGSRRPLEGTKSWTRERFFATKREAMEAGLKPATWNPELELQEIEHNARKFVAIQELLKDLKALGADKIVRPGEKPPENFDRYDGRWSKIYINPNIEVREYWDKLVTDGLNAVADKMGIPHERRVAIGGTRLGYAELTPGKVGRIVTRFATPESVIAHEIGHQIDSKYGLEKKMVKNPRFSKELRALADLKFEGQEPSPQFRKIVRRGEEKMATMLEALIHAPEKFKQVAPNTYKAFTDFLGSHEETKPLLDIRPSLVMDRGTGTVSAGGIVLGGEHWGQRDLVRIINNHMSTDHVLGSVIGRTLMRSRDWLNMMQLGLSAFHGSAITQIAVENQLALGLREAIAAPDGAGRLRGLAEFAKAHTVVQPIYHAMREGWKFYHGAPDLEALERQFFTSGGKLGGTHPDIGTSAGDIFLRNARRVRTYAGAAKVGALAKAAIIAPFAAVEAPIRIISSFYTEPAKIAAWRDLYAAELRLRADDLESGKITHEQVGREVYREVDNRMGLYNYDNLHWNRTLKSAIMVLVRAPGWRLGTARALGGATFIDLPRLAARGVTGRLSLARDFTPRMAYALSAVYAQFMMATVYQYLHTGHRPQTLEDYIAPDTGLRDAIGRKIRAQFPNYISRDVAHAIGDFGGYLASGVAPEVMLAYDLIRNQGYRGPISRPIRSMDDWFPAAGDVMKYLFYNIAPIALKQRAAAAAARGPGGHPEAQAEAALGVVRRPERKPPPQKHWRPGAYSLQP